MLIKPCRTEGIRDQSSSRNVSASHDTIGHLLRIESLAVEQQLRVELTRSPATEYRSNGCFTNAEQIREWTYSRSRSNDLSDIEITVCKTVKSVTNAEC